MRRCPYCNSIYVCWNWVHVDKDKLTELNPWRKPFEFDHWGHECWDCDNVMQTTHKVTNGMPYFIAVRLHRIKYILGFGYETYREMSYHNTKINNRFGTPKDYKIYTLVRTNTGNKISIGTFIKWEHKGSHFEGTVIEINKDYEATVKTHDCGLVKVKL